VIALLAGLGLWACARIEELGAIQGETCDPSQCAQIIGPVPAWTFHGKVLGLLLAAVAATYGLVALVRRRRRDSAP
jgi:hypothetical protein